MKPKNKRDYLELSNCIVHLDPEGCVLIQTMQETIRVTKKEWQTLIAFVTSKI
jgi:hypothetical protein